jgi:hypothetical protein
MFYCVRCSIEQTREETRPGDKLKKLSKETSRLIRMCKLCNCRVFFNFKWNI